MAVRSMIATAVLIAAGLALLAAPSRAGDPSRPLGVVELFTSQGCNSCPPADAVLEDLSRSGEVVTLGYHVDYWDYLGWKDTLARPESTARQYGYRKAFGIRSVYTPQAVVNGRAHVNGADSAAVSALLDKLDRKGGGMNVPIRVTRTTDSVLIDADGAPDGKGNAHVVLVFFKKTMPILIDRGENKGRTVRYANPVTDVQTAGMWHGRPTRIELPRSELSKEGGCAVLLQSVNREGLPGPILGATLIKAVDN